METRKLGNLEVSAVVTLTADDLREIDRAASSITVHGLFLLRRGARHDVGGDAPSLQARLSYRVRAGHQVACSTSTTQPARDASRTRRMPRWRYVCSTSGATDAAIPESTSRP